MAKVSFDPTGAKVSSGKSRMVTADVYEKHSGHLVCDTCTSLWCKHIETVMNQAKDAQGIEEMTMQAMHAGHEYLPFSIPLMPSEGIFAKVIVMPLVRPNYVAKVYLQSPPNTTSGMIIAGDDQLLGIITSGEGRRVIRSLTVEFLWPAMETRPTACVSTLHNYERKANVETFPGNHPAKDKLLMAWANLWYSKCYPCFRDEGAQVEFDSDLIPDAPAPPWRGDAPRRRYTSPASPRFKM